MLKGKQSESLQLSRHPLPLNEPAPIQNAGMLSRQKIYCPTLLERYFLL